MSAPSSGSDPRDDPRRDTSDTGSIIEVGSNFEDEADIYDDPLLCGSSFAGSSSLTATYTTRGTTPSPGGQRDTDDAEANDERRRRRREGTAGTEGSRREEKEWTPVPDSEDGYNTKLTASVAAHVYEGGRRYHAYRDGRYAFPNDETEQNRDDMKHAMTLMLMRGKYFYAPVDEALEKGGEVLDLGTGTGIWAFELADKYPKTTVRGVDLSPIQPTYVPENCFFAVDDIEDEWVDPENKFDFIHVRHTLHSIQNRQALLHRALRHLKPGGYIEFQELHYQIRCDDSTVTSSTTYPLRDFTVYMEAGLRALCGSELNAAPTIASELRAAGFDDVREHSHKCPVGVWPRDRRLRCCGMFLRTAAMDGLRGLAARPLGKGLGWLPLQIEIFLVEVRRAIMDVGCHTYFPFHVVYGRKPLEDSTTTP